MLFSNLLLLHGFVMLCLSAWEGVLKSEQINRVNAFYDRSLIYHITARLFNFKEMLDEAARSLVKEK